MLNDLEMYQPWTAVWQFILQIWV